MELEVQKIEDSMPWWLGLQVSQQLAQMPRCIGRRLLAVETDSQRVALY